MSNLAVLHELPWLWIGSRSLGIAAWIAASATVIFGLAFRTKIFSAVMAPRTVTVVHRSLATTTVVLAVGHVILLVVDPYAHLRVIDAFIPGLAQDRTFANGLGTVAFVLLLAVLVTSILRSKLSARTWKVVHISAYAVWPLATIHFAMAGTDVFALAASVAVVAVLAMLNVLLWLRGEFSLKARQ